MKALQVDGARHYPPFSENLHNGRKEECRCKTLQFYQRKSSNPRVFNNHRATRIFGPTSCNSTRHQGSRTNYSGNASG